MNVLRAPSIARSSGGRAPSLFAGKTGYRWAVASLWGVLLLVAPRPSAAAPGDLDPTFNGTGKIVTEFGAYEDKGWALAVQPDGRIVVAGFSSLGGVLMRYCGDGSLDTTFNGSGKVTNSVAAYYAVALQADGKIVTAGGVVSNKFLVARYTTNGVLDSSFGSGGMVATLVGTSNDTAQAVAVQADGRIVAAGYVYTPANNRYDFGLARYTTNGVLDTTFSSDGKLTTSFGTDDDQCCAVAIQSNGRILAAGYAMMSNGYHFALARVLTNGTLDTTFSGDGKLTTDFGGPANWAYGQSVAVQSDQKILVAGYVGTSTNDHFALVRLSTNGVLDTTFNGTGKVITPVGAGNSHGRSIAIQPDGKILVAGDADDAVFGLGFALARYTTNGVLDTTFNGSGKVTTSFASVNAYGQSAALQPDGKIVVAGYVTDYGTWYQSDIAMARYDSGDPEIAVEQPAGTNLVDGASTVAFGASLTWATSSREFTIKNTGFGSTLTGMGITFDGTNAADFHLFTLQATAVGGPNGSTTFTVRFATATAGSKSAALHITSNDADENPFDINLTGRGLAPDADEDGDGVTNEAEVNMASLGFDPLVDSTDLRTLIHDNRLGMDLYRDSDMQTLALGCPQMERDRGTGHFHLTIGIDRSQDLRTWNPLTGFSPTYDEPSGMIDIDITPDGSNPQFFKVIGKKP